jgi:predicted dehydrogenase
MDQIRWGILGAGSIAATVGADIAATDGNTLQAVGARSGDRAAAFAAAHGVARSYGSYAELVADPDVDVVYVATTHGQHHEHARLALDAGKPVLVEKPLTLTAAQARDIVATARERGLFCMEAMWTRLDPMIRAAADLIATGRIGDVVGVRADLSETFPYDPTHRMYDLAVGGGALLDLGIYPATLAWVFLGRPESVQATGSLAPTGSDVTTAMQWSYPDGRVAQIYASAAGESPLGAVITGTAGWIELDPPVYLSPAMTVHDSGGTQTIEAEPRPGNGYTLEVAEVARCLRAGLTESPFVPLDESVAMLEVFDEARRQLGVTYPGVD